MFACQNKNCLVPELLIRNANPNAQTLELKETALHIVIHNTNDNDSISLLRAFGADTRITDKSHNKAIYYTNNNETRIRLEETPQEAYSRVQEIIENTKLASITVSPTT